MHFRWRRRVAAAAVDVATGATVAANNNNANGVVVPTSSTEDEGTYVDAYVAFEGACFGVFAFVDSSWPLGNDNDVESAAGEGIGGLAM